MTVTTLQSGAPRVTLRSAPPVPYDGAMAAARTCYSPRVVVPAEITESQRQNIGKLTYDALRNLDLPVIMATVIYASFFIVAANALVDVLYAALDPRIRAH